MMKDTDFSNNIGKEGPDLDEGMEQSSGEMVPAWLGERALDGCNRDTRVESVEFNVKARPLSGGTRQTSDGLQPTNAGEAWC